ncbi:hydrophobic/amphiphilic exporter-1, HAE1 family [Cnuella takakiae]|uniref:Hydrophobic/amphiphilic exporter-1, HAE1 family n=1 Tax=Cnuella takakiae TaxID=1302690 RepID=A0A1M5CPT4_9BACT|nr:efflux RND transporter permease subunit [Cnuella takakiae]OLY91900.1 acriflavin resistance protein [Cnuella takakiae]SHF56703.1 hydrophobic/amphiphilic exporter-1, HAE1 family [Cnuella takakiae]
MKLAEVSIKRPTLVIVLFTVLILGGLLSYSTLNYELLPKFSPSVVSVTTIYPGASPSEVENTVSKKIEDAVSSMENIKKLDTRSFESVSSVVITLNSGTDVDYALNDAQRRINAILKDLPEDVDPPSLNKFSLDDLPIMTLSASGKMDEAGFYDLMDKRIAPVLSRVEGVAQVNLVGGQEREIQVSIDANKLEGYGLSLLQVQNAILSSNLDFPTGSVQTREQDVLIRLSGKYRNVEELRNLVIASPTGAQIRLSEVADVQDAQKDVDKIARVNQQSAIAVQVIKQSDANAVGVSEQIRASIEKLEKDYAAQGLTIAVANDSSVYTLQSADAVIHDLILAIVLVAFVMLFFLHSIRNALIVMVAIPASLIATFIGMALLGYTLNLMSLLALSLVVGILVDDAIVVLENIYRHMEMGKNRVRASYDATKEIGFTVTSITLVIVVVFVPIALSTGLAADIIKQFAVTVSIATLLSLLSSFTIVPWLSSRFGKLERVSDKNIFGRIIIGFERGLNRFTEWVGSILKWSLAHKKTTLAVVFALLFGSFYLLGAGFIGAEFFAKSDRGEFLVQIEMPKDASIEQTNAMTQRAENYLRGKREVTKVITTVGQSSEGMGASQSTPYKSEINVQLVDKKERADASNIYAAKIKKELEPVLVGAKVKTVPVSILGSAEQAPLALVVTGPELDSVMTFANAAMAELKKVQGATEMRLSVESGNPEINVQVDRDKMAALGLSLSTVGATMQTAFSGNTNGKFRQGEYEYDINIRYGSFNRQSIQDVSNLLFINNKGEQIRLAQFAAVKESSGPSQLERRDKSTSVTVQAQTVGRPTGTVAAEWQAAFDKLRRPTGVSYVWSGDMENQSEGFGSLGIALLAAIVLVYLIMVALYNSFVYPFVVLFSIPLSIIGALLALALTNNSLNLFTILGLIMLIGLVAKNAIMLVDFTNQRKAEGASTYQALLDANHARLRPILMTTIAMVIGMLPIAIASGAGAEWKNGLAWVIIGGLVSSLFLTLVVVPVMYSIFDKLIAKARRGKKELAVEELMTEDYEEVEVEEHQFNPAHI